MTNFLTEIQSVTMLTTTTHKHVLEILVKNDKLAFYASHIFNAVVFILEVFI